MKHFEAHGARVAYATWGSPRDRALLFFHGFPGSHLQASALEPLVAKHRLFVVACDRPGYGESYHAGSNAKFLTALRDLMMHLGHAKFDVIGVSGGAPWAHLMSSQFAESVRSMQIVCGLSTFNSQTESYFSDYQRKGLAVRRFLPTKAAEIFIDQLIKGRDPAAMIPKMLSFLDPSDRELLQTKRQWILNSLSHARLQGAKGMVRDSGLYHRDWLKRDCDPRALAKVPTSYFHGKDDRVLDYRMSAWMHKANPHSELRFFENEGHYSLAFRQAEAILAGLKKVPLESAPHAATSPA